MTPEQIIKQKISFSSVRHTNGTFWFSGNHKFYIEDFASLFISAEIRYEKNEVLRIYVIRFMAWKWNGENGRS